MLNRLNRITILPSLWLLCNLGLLLTPLQMPAADAGEVTASESPVNDSAITTCCSEIKSPSSSPGSTEAFAVSEPLPQADCCCQYGSDGDSCTTATDECDCTCRVFIAGIQLALTLTFSPVHPPLLNRLLLDTGEINHTSSEQEAVYRPPISPLS